MKAIIGFTAITSGENIAATTGSATMMISDMKIARIIAPTTDKQAITRIFRTPAFGPAFCFRVKD